MTPLATLLEWFGQLPPLDQEVLAVSLFLLCPEYLLPPREPGTRGFDPARFRPAAVIEHVRGLPRTRAHDAGLGLMLSALVDFSLARSPRLSGKRWEHARATWAELRTNGGLSTAAIDAFVQASKPWHDPKGPLEE